MSTRDSSGYSRPAFVDLSDSHPERVIFTSTEPAMDLGEPGTFDQDGVVCTSILAVRDDQLEMLYAGFERGTRHEYRLLTGVAYSTDGGLTFSRQSSVPLLERCDSEALTRAGAVHVENVASVFKEGIIYSGGSEWIACADGRLRPTYSLRLVNFANRFAPGPSVKTLLEPGVEEHGFGRPWGIPGNECGLVAISIRDRSISTYRLGLASIEATGLWRRIDDEIAVYLRGRKVSTDGFMFLAAFVTESGTFAVANGPYYGRDGFWVGELQVSCGS